MTFNTLHDYIAEFFHHPKRLNALNGPFGLVPTEIPDLIISHLALNKAILLQYVLIHPTWTCICRHYYAPLLLFIPSNHHVQELMKVLSSPHKTLSVSITGLTLFKEVPLFGNGKSPLVQPYTKLLQLLDKKNVTLCLGGVENNPSLLTILSLI
ncbi:hypothetical protein CPB85DRAFT_1447105 [Mucidula mucida]|nr:hypothetical protein CPB85DRAFT_1447105 [Mucidula mucida]